MFRLLYKILKHSYWLAIAWVVIIFILLVMPAKDVPSVGFLGRLHIDKAVHFGLFGSLVAFWTIPYANRHSPDKNTRFFLLVCLAACAFGAGMEFFQLEFTDRDYENGDIIADAIGAITGMVISMAWVKAEKKKEAMGDEPGAGTKGKPL